MKPRWSRQGFGIGLILVVLLFTILLVMLSAQSRSTRSLAFERNLSFLGSQARVASQNALNEAFYHFITRANSPRLSKGKKEPVNLFEELRALKEGQGLEYEFAPVMTQKIMRRDRISTGKVQVDLLAVEEFPSQGPTQVTSSTSGTRVTTGVTWPAPTSVRRGRGPSGWPGRPGAATASRACDLINLQFQPQVKMEGVARFRVTAKVDGLRSDVSRQVEVRKGFRILQVTPAGDLLLVRLSPNDIASRVSRSVVANE